MADLSLSLQFARSEMPRAHREVLTRNFVSRCLRAALAGPAEITVRVVDAEEGQALNRDYRQRDYATNVLTFDYAQEPVVMADLVLCAPVVAQEAQAQGLELRQHYAHLLVHGALHALGHDHQEDDQAQVMEALESEIMQRLGFRDPWASVGQ